MSTKNFGEFMEIFLKGLKPFKIQISFKLVLFLNFKIQNPEGSRSQAKKEIFSIGIYLQACQV
jgi:hypothetical protein